MTAVFAGSTPARAVIFRYSVIFGQLAQLVERRTENPSVVGSTPTLTTTEVYKMIVSLKDIAYVFTVIGGGWGYNYDLYLITKDDKLYHTKNFNEDLLCNKKDFEVDYLGHLYNDIRNCTISVSKSSNSSEKIYTYLFDLLNENGKVDFEAFETSNFISMDAPYTSIYKNEGNDLRALISNTTNGSDIPAIRYTLAVVAQLEGLF